MAWKVGRGKASVQRRKVVYVPGVVEFQPLVRPQSQVEDSFSKQLRGRHRPHDEAAYGTGGGEWGFYASKGRTPNVRIDVDPHKLEKWEDRECRTEQQKVRDRVDRMHEIDHRFMRSQLMPFVRHCVELSIMGQDQAL